MVLYVFYTSDYFLQIYWFAKVLSLAAYQIQAQLLQCFVLEVYGSAVLRQKRPEYLLTKILDNTQVAACRASPLTTISGD